MSKDLALLEERIAWELDVLSYPLRPWVVRPRHLPPTGEEEYDVVIVGGGQCGLAACFALLREGVDSVVVLDEHPQGKAGPWTTFARMPTLRTPKYLTSMDLGYPSLTVRAWFEAVYGKQAWQELRYIPREDWARYLSWYEAVLKLPVRHQCKVGAITWDDRRQMFALPISGMDGGKQIFARKVVLATGIDGSGSWEVPALIRENLPKHLYQHTNENIDFTAMHGKCVGVLGAGASAFDNAILACKSGAKKVQLFYRRSEMVRVNPYRWAEYVGFLKHFPDLSRDEDKWAFIQHIIKVGQLPPPDTYNAAVSFPQFSMQAGSHWQVVKEHEGKVHVEDNWGNYLFDSLIIGTGFVTDLSKRSELAELHPYIALWEDRFTPPQDYSGDLLQHPYLGKGFNFQEKRPGEAPYLQGLFNYNFGCLLSNGFGGASITGMKYSVQRLVQEVTRQLFEEGKAEHLASLYGYNSAEF